MTASEGFQRLLSPAQKCQPLPRQLPLIRNIGTSEICLSPEISHFVLDSSYTKKSENLFNLNQRCLYVKNMLKTMSFFPMAGKLTSAYRRDHKQKENEDFGKILGRR